MDEYAKLFGTGPTAPVDSAPTADPSSAASAPAPLTVPPSMPGLSGLPGLTPATPSSAAAKPPTGAEDLKKRMPAAPVPTPPVAPPLASTATAPPQTGAEPGAEPKAAVAAPAQPEESKDGQAPTASKEEATSATEQQADFMEGAEDDEEDGVDFVVSSTSTSTRQQRVYPHHTNKNAPPEIPESTDYISSFPASGNAPLLNEAVYTFDVDQVPDKPWTKPGVDLSDFFNYGFTERTWKLYCQIQNGRRNAPARLQALQKQQNSRGGKQDNPKAELHESLQAIRDPTLQEMEEASRVSGQPPPTFPRVVRESSPERTRTARGRFVTDKDGPSTDILTPKPPLPDPDGPAGRRPSSPTEGAERRPDSRDLHHKFRRGLTDSSAEPLTREEFERLRLQAQARDEARGDAPGEDGRPQRFGLGQPKSGLLRPRDEPGPDGPLLSGAPPPPLLARPPPLAAALPVGLEPAPLMDVLPASLPAPPRAQPLPPTLGLPPGPLLGLPTLGPGLPHAGPGLGPLGPLPPVSAPLMGPPLAAPLAPTHLPPLGPPTHLPGPGPTALPLGPGPLPSGVVSTFEGPPLPAAFPPSPAQPLLTAPAPASSFIPGPQEQFLQDAPVERKHPCLRVLGACKRGEDCEFFPFPYEACLLHLQNKCSRVPCPDLHLDEAEIRTAERERFLRRKRKEALGDEFLTLTGEDGDALTLTGAAGSQNNPLKVEKIERSHRHTNREKDGRERHRSDRPDAEELRRRREREKRHRAPDGNGREEKRPKEKKRRAEEEEVVLAGPGAP